MQYTLRNIPPAVDLALRRRAKQEGRSLNEVAIELLASALGERGERIERRSLDGIAGTWQEDPEIDAALADQRRIDEDLWSGDADRPGHQPVRRPVPRRR